jgi:voltage-gated sodium channel
VGEIHLLELQWIESLILRDCGGIDNVGLDGWEAREVSCGDMSLPELDQLKRRIGGDHWRVRWAKWIESSGVQNFVVGVILLNAFVLALETDRGLMKSWGQVLITIDKICLMVFCVELCVKLFAYRRHFWSSGWNIFDFLVIGTALLPAGESWSVLRALRVLRVLRLFSIVPSMRRVVAAFIHAIPGIASVISVMSIFYFTGAVLATKLFSETHPQWFGNLGASLFSLFQIMTLESWSMGIVRPVMKSHPWAWAFFVPFIIVATFTILNLFIGIIVSTMQELSQKEAQDQRRGELKADNSSTDAKQVIAAMEKDLARLKGLIEKNEL